MVIPRIRHYELGLLAAVVLTVLALGGVVARDLRRSADDASQLHDRLSDGVDQIAALQFNMQEVRRILLYALHTADANRQLQYAEQSRSADARVRARLNDHAALSAQPRGLALVQAVDTAWERYLVVRDEVIGLILEGSLSEGVALDENEGLARFNEVRQALSELNASFITDARAQVLAAKTRAWEATVRLTILVMSALFGAAIGIYLVNRRAALEHILHSEAHKGSILQAVPDPIISTDAAGRIIELNDATERVFGFTRAAALGASVEEMVLPRTRRGELATIMLDAHQHSHGVAPRFETLAIRQDGTEFPAELAAVTHQAGADRIWTIHISDMTERHRAEHELRVARDHAEVAAQAQSEFLANMSHELRTPLNGVIGIADLLQRAKLDPPQRELVRMLRSSATALLELVSDVLDYSRIEQGLVDLKPVAFGLRECIESALDTVAEPAARKGLELAYVMDAHVPVTIRADEGRVRQVLLNLLSNAVKFTDAGEVVVRVGTQPLADDRVAIAVSVQDSGPGIPVHLQHKMFERFTQIDSTPTRHHGGAGVGLAVSQRLGRLLEGSLTVDSREGEGATFHFVFSATVVADAREDPLAGSLKGLRVMTLVEPGILHEQLHSLLSRWDVTAIDLAPDSPIEAADSPSAIIVGGHTRGGAGLAQARQYRQQANLHHLPLVIVGAPDDDVTASSNEAVVAKPVHADRLHHALQAIAGNAAAPEEARALTSVDHPNIAVLIAEDNAFNCRVLQMMLNELGITADEVTNGFDAIDRAATRDYDIIFMDVQMPRLDGLETARRIRLRGSRKRPLIIALTANVMLGEEARCLQAGMDGYLSKPLRLDTLVGILRPLGAAAN